MLFGCTTRSAISCSQRAAITERLEGRVANASSCSPFGATLDSIDRGKRDLPLLGVLTGGLAQFTRKTARRREVVHDLKREAHVAPVTGERFILSGAAPARWRPFARCPEQGSGLGAMDGLEQIRESEAALRLRCRAPVRRSCRGRCRKR